VLVISEKRKSREYSNKWLIHLIMLEVINLLAILEERRELKSKISNLNRVHKKVKEV
jgi:hypothetical protein